LRYLEASDVIGNTVAGVGAVALALVVEKLLDDRLLGPILIISFGRYLRSKKLKSANYKFLNIGFLKIFSAFKTKNSIYHSQINFYQQFWDAILLHIT
jgi:hypothetical protein